VGFTPADPQFEPRTRASFARQGAMAHLGAVLESVEPGRVTIALPFRAELSQQHGFFHAGMISAIADSAGGYAGFTLFPPDEVANLYIGPFEFTPAGTPASLVDPDAPDLERFPRAAQAMGHAMTAELGPGDAIYLPHMWWHHVRSLDPLSILVNYWWDEAAAPQPGLAPMDVFIHALLSFESLPQEQRAAWQAMFDHFVFHADGNPNAHVPEGKRGIRGTLSDESKARLRRTLAQMLGR